MAHPVVQFLEYTRHCTWKTFAEKTKNTTTMEKNKQTFIEEELSHTNKIYTHFSDKGWAFFFFNLIISWTVLLKKSLNGWFPQWQHTLNDTKMKHLHWKKKKKKTKNKSVAFFSFLKGWKLILIKSEVLIDIASKIYETVHKAPMN